MSFAVDGETVRAILHSPPGDRVAAGVGIVFCHGWSGSRLGPHRMFVTTARTLSRQGFHCLRIDFRGRGDSDGSTGAASIQSMAVDAVHAVSHLVKQVGVSHTYLLGICSGGKVAITAATRTDAVRGLILWSGEAMGHLRGTETNRRKSLHALGTYARKLVNPATWRKIIRREINVQGVNKALFQQETRSQQEAAEETRVLRAFRDFQDAVLFIYGSNDPDTKLAGERYREFCRTHRIDHEFHSIDGANHSFYGLAWERQVIDLTAAWLHKIENGGAPPKTTR